LLEVASVSLDLSKDEKQYLSNLLHRRHDDLLHELHHAFTREYKDGLKREIELTDELRQKLAAA
jgi:hypothetical protein